MPERKRNSLRKQELDVLKKTKMAGEEFSQEERMTNEVASTEYTGGGGKKRNVLKQDRLETGE